MAIEESLGYSELVNFHTLDNFRLSDLEANAAALNLTPTQCVELITVVDEIDEIVEDMSRVANVVEDMVDNLIAQEDVVYSVDTLKDCVNETENLHEALLEKDKKFLDLLSPTDIKFEGIGDDMVEHLAQLMSDTKGNLTAVATYYALIQNWWVLHTDDILVLLTWADR